MMAFVADLPIAALVAALAVCAVIVWQAGINLARLANDLGRRLSLGQAFPGMLFNWKDSPLREVAAVSPVANQGDGLLAIARHRTLNVLRRDGALSFKNNAITVHDWNKPAEIGELRRGLSAA